MSCSYDDPSPFSASTTHTDASNTDSTPGRDLATLIRRIRMDTLMVPDKYATVVMNDLAYVLSRATRLTAFEFHPGSLYPIYCAVVAYNRLNAMEFSPGWIFRCSHVHTRCLQNPTTNPVADAFYARLASGMRELDLLSSEAIHMYWRCSGVVMHIHDVLRASASTLVSLKLGGLIVDRFDGLDALYAAPLILPALEELYLRHEDTTLMEYVCRAWVLPRLTRFTLLLCPPTWPHALLAAHGQHLRYLHLYPGRLVEPGKLISYELASSTLAQQCPVLQHLILPSRPAVPMALRHPTLRHIDFWSETITGRKLEGIAIGRLPLPYNIADVLHAAVLDRERHVLPALRTVRVLLLSNPQRGFMAVHVPALRHADWPLVCHPDALVGPMAEDGRRFEVFAGAWAVQTPWGVLSLCHPLFHQSRAWPPNEQEDDLPDGVGVDDSMLRAVLDEQDLEHNAENIDANYVAPEEDEDSDYVSDEGCTEEDSDSDGERDEDRDRAELLAGFRRGQVVRTPLESDE